MLAINVLVVERDPVQREDLERGPGRKRIEEAVKHSRAVGGATQASGEAEKAELGHRGRLRTVGISSATLRTSSRSRPVQVNSILKKQGTLFDPPNSSSATAPHLILN